MAVNKIEIALKEALKKAMVKCNFVEDYEINQITIEIPKEKSHGDYSTNIAMQLTRLLRKNPRMIAEQLIEAIDKEEANIDSIEIAGPGFINMFMKKDALTSIIKEVKKLYDSDVPIFAICLGHQLMALATGADTHKMKYGHRGGNHPVKDLATGRVYISSQNHGYVVDTDTLDPNVAVPAFVNVNDGTNEGLKYVGKNIFTVQFHPEACPGPQDSGYLFDRFLEMMGGNK